MKKQLAVYQKYTWVDPAWDLLKVQEIGRGLFKDMKPTKCIAILSKEDDAVGSDSLKFILDNYAGKGLEVLEPAVGNHEILNDMRVKATVISRLVTFFK
jgi:hypothetical protein